MWYWAEYTGSLFDYNLFAELAVNDNYAAYPNHVVLDGYQGGYSWTYETPSAPHPYQCRKMACPPDQDVLGSACSVNAPDVQACVTHSFNRVALDCSFISMLTACSPRRQTWDGSPQW